MRLSITLDLGNDSMESASDASHSIQRSLIQHCRSAFDPLTLGEHGPILDGNGNTVGTWAVIE